MTREPMLFAHLLSRQARLSTLIQHSLRNRHQKSFSLDLGRHNIRMDQIGARHLAIGCLFAGPHADPIVFVGRTDGIIVPARGDAVFGWGEHLLHLSIVDKKLIDELPQAFALPFSAANV